MVKLHHYVGLDGDAGVVVVKASGYSADTEKTEEKAAEAELCEVDSQRTEDEVLTQSVFEAKGSKA